MKTKLCLLFCLLLTLPCAAQWRFNRYTPSASTNAFIGAYSNQAAVNASMDVAAGNNVLIQFYFSLCSTNTGPILTTATNYVTTFWDVSFDGQRWTNEFAWGVRAKTNGEAWDMTNIPVTYPWLRYKYMSNANPAAVTNFSIRVGQKVGL
jgi:hypothetical protein